MNSKNNSNNEFWETDSNGNQKIMQSKLIKFYENEGFANIKINNTNYVLVRTRDNRISESSVEELIEVARDYLMRPGRENIYETFARGVGNYLATKKLSLLKSIPLINDRDGRDYSRLFFQNCFVKITQKDISIHRYSELEGQIWENRVLDRNFAFPVEKGMGQFELFCWNLAKRDIERFKPLKATIGYLLHRNRERGEDKAVILYDENMGFDNKAHGGTGKSLLCEAINQIREVVIFDGKNIKAGSWFRNQRINITTDVMAYDDLQKSDNFEQFFPIITNGVEVEQKRKQAYFIPREMAPKLVLTSNYLVPGPGGSSDKRRRHEFEVANLYSNEFRPEDEFGNRFFDSTWSDDEWNKFDYFFMNCIQTYLSLGLVNAEPINILRAQEEESSCKEFIEFAGLMIEFNKWIDKRLFEKMFKEEYPKLNDTSSKMIAKWLASYAEQNGGKYHSKSSGGKYKFIIKKSQNGEAK